MDSEDDRMHAAPKAATPRVFPGIPDESGYYEHFPDSPWLWDAAVWRLGLRLLSIEFNSLGAPPGRWHSRLSAAR